MPGFFQMPVFLSEIYFGQAPFNWKLANSHLELAATGLVARLLVIDFETQVGSVDQRGFPVSIPESHHGQVVLYT